MRLFDWHCDTVTECIRQHVSLYDNSLHVDIKRGCFLFEHWVQIMAVYISDALSEDAAWAYTLEGLMFLKNALHQYGLPDTLTKTVIDKPNEHIVFPAVENGKAIGNTIGRIDELADLGVVYLTLTWNGGNAIGNGCLSADTAGLSPFGRLVVERLFSKNILPDVSHLNEKGFWDVVALSQGRPFLASHSVSRSICNHPRNLSDDQFSAIIQNGGLVGLNVCASQLGEQTFEQLRRHLDHFLQLGGRRQVAFGMDLDGTALPQHWHGLAFVKKFYEYLFQCGYDQALLDDIFYNNSYDFFAKTLTSKAECIRIGS